MFFYEEKFYWERFGRELNEVEKVMFEVMWSEYVLYKFSRLFFKFFLMENEYVVLGLGEDVGIVKFDDEIWIVVGIESYNYFLVVEFYGGVVMGVGGIVRDIFCMGVCLIVFFDLICFGLFEKECNCYFF